MSELTPEDLHAEMKRLTRAVEDLSDEIRTLNQRLRPLETLTDRLESIGGLAGLLQLFRGRGG